MSRLGYVHTTLLVVSILLGVIQIAMAQQPSSLNTDIRTLEQSKPIEREMAGGDVHSYQVTLTAGEFLRAVVDQRGIDVVVYVFGPDGQKIAEIDSPNGTQGPEPVALEAKASGAYRLEVRPFDKGAAAGRYEARIEELLTAEQYAAHLAAERAKIEAVKKWLAGNAIPLRTVEAGHGFEDLQPLKKLIGGAHLVSLGEATHGTREFFQLKHRMLEFLVSEMGFTIFGIEATMPEAFDVNEYVLTGKGDPVKALAGLYFWTWDTEEVLDMIQWMRRYNADPGHERKVKFYGFDMQVAPRAVKEALNYLRKVDPGHAVVVEKELAMLANPFTAADFANLPKEKKEAAAASINALLTRFDERKQDYVKLTSAAEWAFARQHARIVAQNIEAQITPNGEFIVRDRSMAENIRWILEQEGPGAKMVVWAHNFHVGTRAEGGAETMGANLRKMFGSDMVVFGFAFNQGSFQAIETPLPSEKGLRPFHVGPAPEGSLDATLAAASLQLAAIDLHVLPKEGPVAEWFSAPHATLNAGAVFSEQSAASFRGMNVATRIYDALLFVEKTTSARALEEGKRPGTRKLAAPANLDFESVEGKLPTDWVVPVASGLGHFDFHVETSEENPRSGKRCVMISRAPGRHYGETYGSLQQQIDATAYRGKRVKLRAAVRAEVAGPGNQAYLWLRVLKKGFGPAALAFYNNMADRPITTSEWRDYEVVGDVSMDAETIDYGLALVGNGRAWLDSVSIEVVGK